MADLITEWYLLRAEIDKAKAQLQPKLDREFELRRSIMTTTWKDLKEGVNTFELPGGYVLKGTNKLERKVDRAALPAVIERLRLMNVKIDELVDYKPELAVRQYRQLTDEQRLVMDEALIIKPSAPTLEIVAPKK